MHAATATFGAGCFWGVEELYRQTEGVKETVVGYMGGTLANPTYEQVSTDKTGHVEVVQIDYDPNEVTYETLLHIFWNNHNPTTRNRQGPDVGTQYKSIIFYHTPEQQEKAEASKTRLETEKRFINPIVTEIVPASTFWRAEAYHQKYLLKRGLDACTL